MQHTLITILSTDKYSIFVSDKDLEGPIRINDFTAYAHYSSTVRSGHIAISRYYQQILLRSFLSSVVVVEKVELEYADVIYHRGNSKLLKNLLVLSEGQRIENSLVVKTYPRRNCLCVPLPHYVDREKLKFVRKDVKNYFIDFPDDTEKNCHCRKKICDEEERDGDESGSSSSQNESSSCTKKSNDDITTNGFIKINEFVKKKINYFSIDDKTIFIQIKNKLFSRKVYLDINTLLKTYAIAFNSLYLPHKLKKINLTPIKKIVLCGEVGTGKRSFCGVINDYLGADLKLSFFTTNCLVDYSRDEENVVKTFYEEYSDDSALSFFIVNENISVNFYKLGDVRVLKFNTPEDATIKEILDDYDLGGIVNDEDGIENELEDIENNMDGIVNDEDGIESDEDGIENDLEGIEYDLRGLNFYEIFNLIREIKSLANKKLSSESCKLTSTEKTKKRFLTSSQARVLDDFLTKIKKRTTKNKKETFKNIGGYQHIKDAISECFLRERPRLIDYPRGILLYGPPGCSKTLFARALSSTFNINFLYFSASSIQAKWVGESERNLRNKFREAETMQPSVLFIDEIDAIGFHREKSTRNHSISLVNTLLSLMDGVDKRKTIVFGSTNRREAIDSALLRPGRFDRHIYIGLPDDHDRKEILQMYLEMDYFSEDEDSRENSDVASSQGSTDEEELIENFNNRLIVGGNKATKVEITCKICLHASSKHCFIKWDKIIESSRDLSGAELKAVVNEGKIIFTRNHKDKACLGIDFTEFILEGIDIIKGFKS